MNLPSHLRARLEENWRERIALLLETLQHWPWLETLRTLRQRFREDHLGLTASSLTFTTLISLVPLVTVTLARGAEMGRFLLGSTVVLLFPKDTLRFNPEWAPGRAIRMGEAMGLAA